MLFLYVFLTTLVLTALLVWMIKKYYWGPDGQPPQYRYHEASPKDKTGNAQPPEQAGNDRRDKS